MSETSEEPAITIGFAVRNGEASLDKALTALTRQTHRNLRILISDNESQDGTSAICERWVAGDERIQYVRQPRNIGPILNFHYLLSQAKTSYFMWAAHDDDWSPEYIAANLAVLEARPEVVCSVSEVELIDPPKLSPPLLPGTEPLLGDCPTNLVNYLREPGANSRIYGIYRTEVLRRSFLASDTYWAFDWAIVARTLTYGRHALVSRPLMRRRCRGESSDAERNIPRYNQNWLGRRFPMLPFTWAMLSDGRIPKTTAVLRSLMRWNRVYWKDSMRRWKHRRLYPLIEFLRLRSPRPKVQAASQTSL